MPEADRSLHAVYSSENPNDEERRRYAADLISAVAHLHANGVGHFDIKMMNALRMNGRICITDLDASAALGDLKYNCRFHLLFFSVYSRFEIRLNDLFTVFEFISIFTLKLCCVYCMLACLLACLSVCLPVCVRACVLPSQAKNLSGQSSAQAFSRQRCLQSLQQKTTWPNTKRTSLLMSTSNLRCGASYGQFIPLKAPSSSRLLSSIVKTTAMLRCIPKRYHTNSSRHPLQSMRGPLEL